ncbi:hypothetical protein [Paenarthrobacter sp. C1]|uniref:hypothetical protein n=1 Tax=Paenarthrobacter sp. C1 TaxID=3400220 RepID=UPI003BF595AF
MPRRGFPSALRASGRGGLTAWSADGVAVVLPQAGAQFFVAFATRAAVAVPLARCAVGRDGARGQADAPRERDGHQAARQRQTTAAASEPRRAGGDDRSQREEGEERDGPAAGADFSVGHRAQEPAAVRLRRDDGRLAVVGSALERQVGEPVDERCC